MTFQKCVTIRYEELTQYFPLKEQNEDLNFQQRSLEGKRIIDIQHFFGKLQEIALHNIQLGCAFKDLNILSESTDGLKSQIDLYCNNCESHFSINLTGNRQTKDINSSVVSSAENLGMDMEGLKQLFGNIGVPFTEANKIEHVKVEKMVCNNYESAVVNVKLELEDPDWF